MTITQVDDDVWSQLHSHLMRILRRRTRTRGRIIALVAWLAYVAWAPVQWCLPVQASELPQHAAVFCPMIGAMHGARMAMAHRGGQCTHVQCQGVHPASNGSVASGAFMGLAHAPVVVRFEWARSTGLRPVVWLPDPRSSPAGNLNPARLLI
ncbi:MAG: hypothetical protein ACYCXT_00905 [Acidiferrobacteraceae bacterium]